METEALARILACPHCHSAVRFEELQVTCTSCSRSYPLRNGVPWLRMAEAGAAHEAIPPVSQDNASGLRRIVSRLPLASPVYKSAEDRGRIARFIDTIREERPDALILNVGSGSTAFPGTVSLDVDQFDHVQVVGDALSLPVLDGVLDGVITQGVLEHVASPWQAVDEIKRVLKPGGLSYNEVPLIQGDHSTPDCPDYWRFTRSGACMLFDDFELIDAGVVVGPGSGVTWLLIFHPASEVHGCRAFS